MREYLTAVAAALGLLITPAGEPRPGASAPTKAIATVVRIE